MNKMKYILLGVAAAGVFTACDDTLDAPNKSSMSEDVIFSTEVLADGAVTKTRSRG